MDQLPSDQPESGLQVHLVGNERTAVLRIDGFLANPQDFVAVAAKARFAADAEYYPGVRAPVPGDLLAQLAGQASSALNRLDGPRQRLDIAQAHFAMVATPPSRLSAPQRIPHYDASDDRLMAMVLYLSERDWGGTGFFRHRSTGFETITVDRQDHYFASLRDDIGRFGVPRPAYCTLENPLYQPVAAIPASFNRALIYPGKLLHSGLIDNMNVPPADPLRGRLTITCFFSLSAD